MVEDVSAGGHSGDDFQANPKPAVTSGSARFLTSLEGTAGGDFSLYSPPQLGNNLPNTTCPQPHHHNDNAATELRVTASVIITARRSSKAGIGLYPIIANDKEITTLHPLAHMHGYRINFGSGGSISGRCLAFWLVIRIYQDPPAATSLLRMNTGSVLSDVDVDSTSAHTHAYRARKVTNLSKHHTAAGNLYS